VSVTTAEATTIRNDITVTHAATVFQGQTLLAWWDNGANQTLADYYNTVASPVVLMWRPNVNRRELINTLVGSEYTAATAAARSLLDAITKDPLIDTTIAQVRANFALAAGATTQANWTVVARQNATNLEALFAGAPVSGAVVSTRFGNPVTSSDIAFARTV